jgi:hypothetical protein
MDHSIRKKRKRKKDETINHFNKSLSTQNQTSRPMGKTATLSSIFIDPLVSKKMDGSQTM